MSEEVASPVEEKFSYIHAPSGKDGGVGRGGGGAAGGAVVRPAGPGAR